MYRLRGCVCEDVDAAFPVSEIESTNMEKKYRKKDTHNGKKQQWLVIFIEDIGYHAAAAVTTVSC